MLHIYAKLSQTGENAPEIIGNLGDQPIGQTSPQRLGIGHYQVLVSDDILDNPPNDPYRAHVQCTLGVGTPASVHVDITDVNVIELYFYDKNGIPVDVNGFFYLQADIKQP